MRLGLNLLAGIVVVAGTTIVGGWWAVPLVAALWSALPLGARPATVAVSAGVAWALLLADPRGLANLPRLAGRVAGIFGVPPLPLLLVGPLYAALLAASTAALVTILRDAALASRAEQSGRT